MTAAERNQVLDAAAEACLALLPSLMSQPGGSKACAGERWAIARCIAAVNELKANTDRGTA